MIQKVNFQLLNNIGKEIDIDCRFLDGSAVKLPVLIFCHGFKGFKDWGGFPYMMEKFAEAGFFALSFNFSLNGVAKESPMDFTRLDHFADNTISQEIEDLKNVLDHISLNKESFNVDIDKIGLIGHSRGGGIAIIETASESEKAGRIKALVTLASVSHYNRYGKEHVRRWKEQGYFEIENARTKQMMRINTPLLEDFLLNHEKLDVTAAAADVNVPFLIIHGSVDLSVKPEEAEQIYNASDKKLSELFIVQHTGHTFGTVHPFEGTTPAFEKVIEKTIEFMRTNLL